MMQLMRACQFLRGDVAMMAAPMRSLLLAGGTLMPGVAFFCGVRRRLMVRGVMTARVGRFGVMGRFRGMLRGLRSRVRCVMRRGLRFLPKSGERGSDSKTKQDEESPRSTRKLPKKAETAERP